MMLTDWRMAVTAAIFCLSVMTFLRIVIPLYAFV